MKKEKKTNETSYEPNMTQIACLRTTKLEKETHLTKSHTRVSECVCARAGWKESGCFSFEEKKYGTFLVASFES